MDLFWFWGLLCVCVPAEDDESIGGRSAGFFLFFFFPPSRVRLDWPRVCGKRIRGTRVFSWEGRFQGGGFGASEDKLERLTYGVIVYCRDYERHLFFFPLHFVCCLRILECGLHSSHSKVTNGTVCNIKTLQNGCWNSRILLTAGYIRENVTEFQCSSWIKKNCNILSLNAVTNGIRAKLASVFCQINDLLTSRNRTAWKRVYLSL